MNESPQIVDLKPYSEPERLSIKKVTGSILIIIAVILLIVSSIPYLTYALEQTQGRKSASKELPETSTTLNGAAVPRIAGVTSEVQPKPQSNTGPADTQLPLGDNASELASGIGNETAGAPKKGEEVGYLYVNGEKINVNAPVIEGVDTASFLYGVGHQPGTALPNTKSGNVVIAGHRWLPKGNAYSKIFFDLPEIQIGETIDYVYNDITYTYEVYATEIVKPTDVHILEHTDEPELTIYTCHPWNSTKSRFIVHSRLKEAR